MARTATVAVVKAVAAIVGTPVEGTVLLEVIILGDVIIDVLVDVDMLDVVHVDVDMLIDLHVDVVVDPMGIDVAVQVDVAAIPVKLASIASAVPAEAKNDA
jgi:hypothetical protein